MSKNVSMTHEELHAANIPHDHTEQFKQHHELDHIHSDYKDHEHEHVHGHSHGHGVHKHVHSAEEKKAVINRLSKAIGHLEAVKRMVERGDDCSDVLIQLAAVRSAINNTGKLVLKNHINHCVIEAVEQDDQEALERLNQAIDRFMK